jgi:Fur family ferric uptake transcriptional regulator
MEPLGSRAERWATVRDRLRAGGQRWTPQRRLLLEVLEQHRGHVTAAEVIERCRELDPETTPSTIYRSLDVLEDLGIIRHAHRPDGREEFHVLPEQEHGHLHCITCGGSWEVGPVEAEGLVDALVRARGFEVDLSHLSIVGRCAACSEPPATA